MNFDPSWTVCTRVIREVIQAAQHLGCDRRQFLLLAGLDEGQLNNASNRFTVGALYRLYRHAHLATNNPDVGLYVGRIAYHNALNLQQHLSTLCRTLRDYLNLIPNVLVFSGDIGVVRIDVVAEELCIQWQPLLPATGHDRYLSDAILSFTLAMMNSICIRPLKVNRVQLSYPKPQDVTLLKDHFGENVSFDHAGSAVFMPAQCLDFSLCSLEVPLLKALSDDVSPMFKTEQTDDFLRVLHRSIHRLLPKGQLTIGAVASDIHVSKRTLQRRLTQRDTQFVQVVQDIRIQLFKRYALDSRLSLAQLSSLLGYTNQSNFNSAFKSWHGCTPRQFLGRSLA